MIRIQMPKNLINYDLANHYRRESKLVEKNYRQDQERKGARLIIVRILQAVLLTVLAIHLFALSLWN